MNYCEKCKSLFDSDSCSACGNKKIREAAPDDFCVLTECDQTYGEMIRDALQAEEIDCVLMPYGNGVRSAFGLRLDKYKVFVPYGQYDRSVELLHSLLNEPTTDALKEQLLAHFDQWHILSTRTEKKIRKKLALGEDADILACIKEGVENAVSIEDKGLMHSFTPSGHGLAVKMGGVTVWFSAESYEILF